MSDEMRWNLDDTVAVDGFDNLLAELDCDLELFGAWYGRMSPGMGEETFRDYSDFSEGVSKKAYRLHYLGHLMSSADTSSPQADLLVTRARDFWRRYADATRGIDHWLKGMERPGKERLDDGNAARLFAALPDLEYSLHRLREEERFTLSEPEERIITMKDTAVTSSLTEMRKKMAARQRYFLKPAGARRGRTVDTESEVRKHFHSPKPESREAAYRALFAEYEKSLDLYFLIYQAVVKDWAGEAKLRGYESPIAMRNFGNQVPDEAIETLLQVCSDNRDIFHRWFTSKAKMLGVDRLRRFDIYAPLDEAEKATFSFTEAIDLVLTTLGGFSPRFAEHAQAVVAAQHIDSHPRKNKKSGAFCATVGPDIAPYVMMNFDGTLDSVSTLAHELGHAIHSLYASHHPHAVQHAPLPLCETASTLCEMVMFDRLLEEAESDEVRKSMLAGKMDDAYGTIMRQAYFVMFEKRAHGAIAEGTTAEGLSDLYVETLKEQFGESVEIDPAFRYEWSVIPHIVNTPFYCYAYSFGDLLSLALYGEYKEQGAAFIPKIERILAAGGSEEPAKVLKDAGIDMSSREFWQKSFDILRGMQDRLESYD